MLELFCRDFVGSSLPFYCNEKPLNPQSKNPAPSEEPEKQQSQKWQVPFPKHLIHLIPTPQLEFRILAWKPLPVFIGGSQLTARRSKPPEQNHCE